MLEYLVDERSELDETSAGLQILGRLANCNGVLREWLSPGSTCQRKNVLDRLPFVGRGWYAKPVCAYLLEAGMAQLQHFKWSLDATAHVDQQCLEQVLQRMEHSWPEGEEHYAKLAINSLVGLFARNLELVYSMKTSNHQVDGEGCS